MANQRIKIKVFITKTRKFRAEINDDGNQFSLTVGGKSWKSGSGKKYHDKIIEICQKLNKTLTQELDLLNDIDKISINNIDGNNIFEYSCENNNIQKTLEYAISKKICLRNCLLVGEDLSEMIFNKVDLQGSNFIDCELIGTKFINCNLHNSEFHDSNGKTSEFHSCSMRNVIFRTSDMTKSIFLKTDILEVDLRDSNFEFSSFISCDLRGFKFKQSNLSNSSFSYCEGTELFVSFKNNHNYKENIIYNIKENIVWTDEFIGSIGKFEEHIMRTSNKVDVLPINLTFIGYFRSLNYKTNG